MMWNYVQLPDGTQFAYSELQDDCTVRIAVERPVDYGFDSARCVMPAYRWRDVEGFSEEEMARIDEFVRSNAPLIYELAEEKRDERDSGRKVA